MALKEHNIFPLTLKAVPASNEQHDVTDGHVAGGLGDDDALHLVLVEVEVPPQELDLVAEEVDFVEVAGVVRLEQDTRSLRPIL